MRDPRFVECKKTISAAAKAAQAAGLSRDQAIGAVFQAAVDLARDAWGHANAAVELQQLAARLAPNSAVTQVISEEEVEPAWKRPAWMAR